VATKNVSHTPASWRADLRSVSDRRVDSSLDFGLARTSSVRSRLPPDRGRMPEYFLLAVRGHTVVTGARRAEALSAVGEYNALLAGCAHVTVEIGRAPAESITIRTCSVSW